MGVCIQDYISNKKIYVGSDTSKDAKNNFYKYFGSPSKWIERIKNDMSQYLGKNTPYLLEKEILFEKENVSVKAVKDMETVFIRKLKATDPQVGYNYKS